ncbi:RNA polymerase sigma factor [Aliidongia dinghuensis]|uniref:RNA polymerase sigma factor n=1 Tax=Aliidongia dinghuensis TaxID=1867774 RepID=UPI001E3FF185|nr:sigma-70 family RNA polymerase sigma factor [Aliidongia dinghuensis]
MLIEQYDDLRRRLTRRLGSADAAHETLHELYLRMDRPDGVSALRNPATYILAVAVNLARDRWRTENRRAERVDESALYELIDENPGPEQVAEGRSSLEALVRALDLLTPRQRMIMVAARFERLPQAEIARRLNISTRLVQIELQRALEFCEEFLAKNLS